MSLLIILVIFTPLLGVGINLLSKKNNAGIIATAAAGSAFIASVGTALNTDATPQTFVITRWLSIGNLDLDWALHVDPLAITMLLVVTGVGTLIHLYSIEYMQADPHYRRFFIYLNLFLVMMLLLVLADNLLVMFVGWEGVGLCSFLLIGFWFEREASRAAAVQAFIINRIGDAGFILAMVLIARRFGTLVVRDLAPADPDQELTVITLLLLMGVIAKSAQLPLYLWLPDAMVGPTPASALIHAATMVTAGVYLIVRLHLLFALAPLTQTVIIAVGCSTALYAAWIALSQTDIKRLLAYSTISQLGFMIAAAGMGAYSAAMFHLITHAFFKALLFLAAGSVVHQLHTQDMRQMGGLRYHLPWTFRVYTVAALALAGIPPLSGFFSKDEILNAAVAYPLAYMLLSVTTFLTALYMGQQLRSVFLGEERSEAAYHATESPRLMLIPMLALAFLALMGGMISLPGTHTLAHWLALDQPLEFRWQVAAFSIFLSLAGLLWRPSIQLPRLEWQAGALVHSFNHLTGWLAAVDLTYFARLDRRLYQSVDAISHQLGSAGTASQKQINLNGAGMVIALLLLLILAALGRAA